jgi:hypothetical protein
MQWGTTGLIGDADGESTPGDGVLQSQRGAFDRGGGGLTAESIRSISART